MSTLQLGLFESAAAFPDGFRYRPELITSAEECELVLALGRLDFRPFEFHGYLGRRRVVSFGLHYDFGKYKVCSSPGIPDFLLPLRDRAAVFAGIAPASLSHALVNEYEPGAPIGWHRDRPVFGDVIGVSLNSPCRFRFRRKISASDDDDRCRPRSARLSQAEAARMAANRGRTSWERRETILQPRSIYLLRGAARTEWEHSIPPAGKLRYSVTFRTVAETGAREMR